MLVKIEIKHRWLGKVLFSYEKEENTIKDTLEEAVKQKAYLVGAYLRGAYLSGAYLSGAYLSGADLRGADLRENTQMPYFPLACPSDGAFIGWKKAYYQGNAVLVKLEIPEDARRLSATENKCRADKAKVLSITRIEDNADLETAYSGHDHAFLYEVGKEVSVPDFDENRWHECAPGIHFFINKQDAINY